MDANKWLTREALEERAAYYDKWAADIRAMNGHSVDADHSEQTAAVLRFLARWREEALEVERSWDAQAIAKLLNLKPGEDIRAAIQPAISDLTKRLEIAAGYCADWEALRSEILAALEVESGEGCGEWDDAWNACRDEIKGRVHALLSRERASERQLPRDPLSDNPADGDENAPGDAVKRGFD